jgi:hypothetical protein
MNSDRTSTSLQPYIGRADGSGVSQHVEMLETNLTGSTHALVLVMPKAYHPDWEQVVGEEILTPYFLY